MNSFEADIEIVLPLTVRVYYTPEQKLITNPIEVAQEGIDAKLEVEGITYKGKEVHRVTLNEVMMDNINDQDIEDMIWEQMREECNDDS